MSHAYVTTGPGQRELCLYYGDQEVSFDEERLFPFGEQLARASSFVASDATSWGPGYAWDELREMFEALIEAGIVKHGDAADDPRGGSRDGTRPPPSACPVPRMWSAAECESITRELGGRALEIGNLEAVIPSYRIAHPALDADGRQVGEANVFPPRLRLDRDTEWRVCQYAGSRYRDDAPMNITALKAMIKHWKPMMATLLAVRGEVLGRMPRSCGGWTTGDLHTFSRVVLALLGYQLMKRGGQSPQVPLHPVLSSLYRITDGIRLTTHDMLFLSAERTRRPEEPITAAELYGFAERNGAFLSDYGVCAGPKALIDEFFTAVFDGIAADATAVHELPAEVRELLAELPAAIDYGLLGLQVWAVSRSVWLAMSLAHRAVLRSLEAARGERAGRLRARLGKDWHYLERERIAIDAEIDVHRDVYADAYEQSWRALGSATGAPALAERLAPRPFGDDHRRAAAALRAALGARLVPDEPDEGHAAALDRIAAVLVDYLREEQAVLASSTAIQGAINALLERAQPARPLAVRDVRMLFAMHSGPLSVFPYLFDTLEDELGVRIECTADAIEVTGGIGEAGQG